MDKNDEHDYQYRNATKPSLMNLFVWLGCTGVVVLFSAYSCNQR